MGCLFCRNFAPTEPADHKELRESGRCQSNCGTTWDSHTAARYVREHKQNLTGWCLLHPEGIQKNSGHVCGQIDLYDYIAGTYPRPHTANQSLKDWAAELLQTHVHGNWQRQRMENLTEENQQLRARIKNVQKISASRLARLQKAAEPKRTKPAPRPQIEHKPEPAPLPQVAARPQSAVDPAPLPNLYEVRRNNQLGGIVVEIIPRTNAA